MRFQLGLAAMVGLFGGCGASQAATLYVSVNGSDVSGCGTRMQPCKTIQYTINNRAASGDTVAIAQGTYAERVSVPDGLTLKGTGFNKTFLDGGNHGTVLSTSGTVQVESLTVQHGKSANCGGGILNNGDLTLQRVVVSDNSTNGGDEGSGEGAGICNQGSLTIVQSRITGNSAEEAGGIFNLGNHLVISQSTIDGNSTQSFGAGIESFGPTTISNSTLSGNSAIYGGAIENYAPLDLFNCTITNNTAQIGAGIDTEAVDGGSVSLSNTILSGNNASFSDPDCNGNGVTSNDYNLIGSTAGCSIALAPHDLVGPLPLLGLLQDNGGPTPTLLPMTGSPAINGGNPAGCTGPNGMVLVTDQRLAPRRIPPCDIGSVEVQGK